MSLFISAYEFIQHGDFTEPEKFPVFLLASSALLNSSFAPNWISKQSQNGVSNNLLNALRPNKSNCIPTFLAVNSTTIKFCGRIKFQGKCSPFLRCTLDQINKDQYLRHLELDLCCQNSRDANITDILFAPAQNIKNLQVFRLNARGAEGTQIIQQAISYFFPASSMAQSSLPFLSTLELSCDAITNEQVRDEAVSTSSIHSTRCPRFRNLILRLPQLNTSTILHILRSCTRDTGNSLRSFELHSKTMTNEILRFIGDNLRDLTSLTIVNAVGENPDAEDLFQINDDGIKLLVDEAAESEREKNECCVVGGGRLFYLQELKIDGLFTSKSIEFITTLNEGFLAHLTSLDFTGRGLPLTSAAVRQLQNLQSLKTLKLEFARMLLRDQASSPDYLAMFALEELENVENLYIINRAWNFSGHGGALKPPKNLKFLSYTTEFDERRPMEKIAGLYSFSGASKLEEVELLGGLECEQLHNIGWFFKPRAFSVSNRFPAAEEKKKILREKLFQEKIAASSQSEKVDEQVSPEEIAKIWQEVEQLDEEKYFFDTMLLATDFPLKKMTIEVSWESILTEETWYHLGKLSSLHELTIRTAKPKSGNNRDIISKEHLLKLMNPLKNLKTNLKQLRFQGFTRFLECTKMEEIWRMICSA